MSIPSIQLKDGNKIPQVGLGTWQITDQDEFQTAFDTAIEIGYRHFDTAQAYHNEQFLGEAWTKSGLKREDLYITTKIAVQNFGYQRAVESFAESLNRLQTDYVDLLLLHFPVTLLRKKTWLAAEEILAKGGAKSIGVSNYTIRHLEEMTDYAKIMPVINQFELHLFLQQPKLVKYCQANNIQVEAYSPLAHQQNMTNPVVHEIAKKHDKSYAQIMLRWLVQHSFVVIPKSATPSRIKENIDIFDFELDEADMTKLESVDKNLRTCWSPVHVP